MGQLVFQATLGGQVNLVGPNTASTFNINVPAVAGNMVTTGDTGTVTNTMLASSAYTAPGTIGSGTPNTGAFTTLSGSTSVTTPILKSASSLTLQTNGTTTAVTIDASQNVGIGTSSPNAPLTFASSTGRKAGFYQGTQGYSIGVEASNFKFVTDSGAAFTFNNGATYSSATEYARIDSSGNFVVGGTDGSYGKLSVRNGYLYVNEDGSNTQQIYVRSNISSGVAGIQVATNNPLAFYTNNTERARIDSSGNLLVGTTTAGSLTNTNSYILGVAVTGAALTVQHASGTSSGVSYAQFAYNASIIGSITQAGTTGVLYNITSDYRLKEVIGPVTDAGARIDALEPIEYQWKSDGSNTRGFLAHKFQEVYPQSVSGEKDAVDEEGNPKYQTMQASTSEVIADLIAEIQSLRKRLTALENK
jgi:Chaperone of endosialidase